MERLHCALMDVCAGRTLDLAPGAVSLALAAAAESGRSTGRADERCGGLSCGQLERGLLHAASTPKKAEVWNHSETPDERS